MTVLLGSVGGSDADVRSGWQVVPVEGGQPGLAPMGLDDWVHVEIDLSAPGPAAALQDEAVRAGAVLSAALVGRGDSFVDDWETAESCFVACGNSGGIILVDEDMLAHLCDAPGTPPDAGEADAAIIDVAAGWAEVYGLALVVVVGPRGSVAMKPDGRFARTDTAASLERSARFIAAYVTNPSDLTAALDTLSARV